MPPVAPEMVRARAKRLREMGDAAVRNHLDSQTGKMLRILMERGGIGRAEDFTRVRLPGAAPSELLDVLVIGNDGTLLHAADAG